MAGEQSFKAVVNDTNPDSGGKSYALDITGANYNHFLGKKIGDSVDGMFVGGWRDSPEWLQTGYNRWLRCHWETDEARLGWIWSQVSTYHSRNRIQGEEVREQEQQGVPIQVRRPEEKKESKGQRN